MEIIRAAAWCARIITAAGAIVPRSRRDEWLREWQAELWTWCNRPGGRGRPPSAPALLTRTAGAVLHALWLRQRDWMIEMLLQDVAYGFRMLRKTPAFTAVAMLTLALGIGATTAMFSVVRRVLLAPLPLAEPERLVQLWESNVDRGWVRETCAPANYRDWKAGADAFAGMTAYMGSDTKEAGTTGFALTGAGEAERVQGVRVAADFFDVIGVRPALGSGFAGEKEWTGNERLVVISHRFWTRRFGGDRSAVGRTIDLDGVPRVVAGVMPEDFAFPRADLDLWVPFVWQAGSVPNLRRPHFIRVVGRLKPGATLAEAQAQLDAVADRLEREYPETNTHMRVGAGPLHEWIVGDQRAALWLFFGVVSAVLLIAATNIANLVLARTLDRQREIAIRLALGATRTRVIRQVITECSVLAAAGGLAGIALAWVLVRALVLAAPPGIPRLDEVRIDPAALGVAFGLSIVVAVLVGLLPALQASAPRFGEWLKSAGRREGTGASVRTRGLLVTAEVALSVVLVFGAVLLSRSLLAILHVNPGFDPANVLTFEIAVPATKYPAGEAVKTVHETIEQRIRSLPGVVAAGGTRKLPATGHAWSSDFTIRGRGPTEFGTEVRHREVTASFFETMRTPIVKGRGFTDADRSTRVVIINETLAQRYFTDDPVGQQLNFDRPGGTSPWRTIVGVVADQKQEGLQKPVVPEIYEPQFQTPLRTLTYAVRAAGDPLALVPSIREAVRDVDPSVPVARIDTLDGVLGQVSQTQRLAALLVSAFAATGLLLAALGIYGVLSYVASRLAPEIGVRVALGAQKRDVLRLVTRRGLGTVGAGLMVGVALAIASTRTIGRFLYGVSAWDPLSYLVVLLLLASVAIAASAVPIRRAIRVDPVIALRSE